MLTEQTARRLLNVMEGRVYPHVKASQDGFVDLGTIKACLAAIEKEYTPGMYAKCEHEKNTFNAGWPLSNFLTSDLRYRNVSKDECVQGIHAVIRNLKTFIPA